MDNKELKEQRTKLYQENKEQYKKQRKAFVYGVSQNFRNIKKNKNQEMKLLNEETNQSYEEGDSNGYNSKKRK